MKIVFCANSAALARASPLNPKVVSSFRSEKSVIFEVQFRLKAKGLSAAEIPNPLSLTWIKSRRFAEVSMVIWVAFASREFSISSLMTDTGSVRVWEDPKARIVSLGRGCMLPIFVNGVDATGRRVAMVGRWRYAKTPRVRGSVGGSIDLDRDEGKGGAWGGKCRQIAGEVV